jgi:SpoVK/Ycf46/Vps4 family AAA+-type ATPase
MRSDELIRDLLENQISAAAAHQKRGNHVKAAEAHYASSHLMNEFAKSTKDPVARKQRLVLADQFRQKAQGVNVTVARNSSAETGAGADDEEISMAGHVAGFTFRSDVTWEHIGGLDYIRDDFVRGFVLKHAKKPEDIQLPSPVAILLKGPPGTGKTLVAGAMANALGIMMLNVPVSGVLSDRFGRSPRLISHVYKYAREHAPSIVFFDEFDGLAAQRSGAESGAERRMLSTLLTELDGLAEKNSEAYVITIASTNCPELLDNAILSRFKTVAVPLPDLAQRAEIVRKIINKSRWPMEASPEYIALRTDRFSGRDLSQLCTAIGEMIIDDENPDMHTWPNEGIETLKNRMLRIRAITETDVLAGLAKFKENFGSTSTP